MNLHGFGYTFPFPIICTDDVDKWPIVSRKISGVRVEIPPPFLSGQNGRLTEDFDVNESPSFKRRRIALPKGSLPPSGFRTLPQCFGDQSVVHPPQTETNAFQIEFQTSSEKRADKIGEWLVKAGLRNLRRSSGQFWIEHPAIYFEGYKKAQYRVVSGQLEHGIWASSSIYSGTLRMLVIDLDKWKKSWISAKENYNSDAFDNLLTAEHQSAGGFVPEAAMNCALAIEKCKYELWSKLLSRGLCAKADERSARNDAQKPERYFGALFPACAPPIDLSHSQLSSITEIWTARGLIAHGKETHLEKALGAPLNRETLKNWIDSLWGIAHKISSY